LHAECKQHEGGDDPEGSFDEKISADKSAHKSIQNHHQQHQGSGSTEEEGDLAEKLHGAACELQQEFDREEIENNAEGPPDSIFGFTGDTGAVIHHDFRDISTHPGAEGWNESVHFSIEADILQDIAAVGLQGAAIVMELNARNVGNQTIREHGREAAIDKGILPVFAPAAHDSIVVRFHFFQQAGDINRIVLEIGIQGDNDILGCSVNAGCHRGRLAEIPAETDQFKMGILFGGLTETFPGCVTRTVIDVDDFILAPDAGERVMDLLGQVGNIGFLVENRNDHGQAGMGCRHRGEYGGSPLVFQEGFVLTGETGECYKHRLRKAVCRAVRFKEVLMAKVVLENVVKVYPGDVTAVHDANLEIQDQEFVVLVGPSGCGKSTTLRMIAGLEDISDGSVFIDGKKVNDIPPKDRDIAMVFQNYALYPHMSVYNNMAFGLKLRKYPKAEIHKRVMEAAGILGITELLERKPKALSGGQRQRVAVGRAIVRKPKAFLFDEPLSNLDAKMRVQMRAEISKLHSSLKSTMIYVTHDQIEAMTMGDRIVVMKDGWIQQVDTPLNIYNHPTNQFVAGFIGSPPMNLFPGKIVRQDNGLTFDEGRFRVALDPAMADKLAGHVGKKVAMGIRPENIKDISMSTDTDPAHMLKATVEVIEMMGSEVFLYASTGQNSFTARVDASCGKQIGDSVELVLDMSKAHFFDGETKKALL